MSDIKKPIMECKKECEDHLNKELLPFWQTRTIDKTHGGFITHFDNDGITKG